MLKVFGGPEHSLLTKLTEKTRVVLDHVLHVSEHDACLVSISSTAEVLRPLLWITVVHVQTNSGTECSGLAVLTWNVDEAFAVSAVVGLLGFPAQQIGVDAGLPAFRNKRKTCVQTLRVRAFVHDKVDDTFPFLGVKVVTFGSNEWIVVRQPTKKFDSVDLYPLKPYQFLLFVNRGWYFDLSSATDKRFSRICFKFECGRVSCRT